MQLHPDDYIPDNQKIFLWQQIGMQYHFFALIP